MNKITGIIMMLLLILIGQGCAVFSTRETPSLPELPSKIVSAPDSSGLKITSALLEMVDDAMAKALVDEALKNNYNLKATAFRLKSSGLLLSRTSTAIMPKLDAGYFITRDNQTLDQTSQNQHKLSLSVNWELDLWGRLADRHKADQHNFDAEQQNFNRAMDSLAARVLQSYFNVKSNKLKLEIQNKQVQIYETIEKNIRIKYHAGLGTLDDISSARTKIDIARSSVAVAQEAYSESVRELEVLLGRYPGMGLEFSGDLPDVSFPTPSVPASILANRPDIQAAMSKYNSAQSASVASHKDMLPNITISSDIFRQSQKFNKLDAAVTSWGLAGNILYPLFNSGRLKNEARASDAEADAAYMEYASTIIQAMKEAENTFSKEKHLKDRLYHLQKAVNHAKQSSQYYEIRYKEGLADIIELYTAKEQELNVMSDIIDVKALRIINRVDMALALGTGVNKRRTNENQQKGQ
ncbi:MAG: TolC family protein [Desulfobacula sp.]|nr:TolC family protein [Desulfobacula sp.]